MCPPEQPSDDGAEELALRAAAMSSAVGTPGSTPRRPQGQFLSRSCESAGRLSLLLAFTAAERTADRENHEADTGEKKRNRNDDPEQRGSFR